jgi:hypothetical protein
MVRMSRLLKSMICMGFVAAAGVALPADEPPGFRLNLAKIPEVKDGRIAFAEGTADGAGHRFMLQNLEIVQPIGLSVVAMRDDTPVEMVLGRDRWDESIRKASTDKGAAGFKLRTQGDIRITVKSTSGAPAQYLLIAWVGDPVKPAVPSVLVARPPGARGWIGWAGGAAVLIVALAGALFWRRRKRAAATLVVILILGAAQQLAAQISPPSSLPAGALPSPRGPVSRGWQQVRDPNSGWNQRLNDLQGERDRFDQGSAPFDFLNAIVQAGFAARDYWNASENFTGDDEGYLPDVDPDSMPELPVGCGMSDQAEACVQCYAAAQDHLQGMMLLLERLRASYDSTKRYTDASISFGDNVSGIHAVSGLAWQTQRRGIMRTFEQFTRTYEEKRVGMMGSLRRALDEINTCESQFFNNPDWYSRFGFVYYQFMDARYRH